MMSTFFGLRNMCNLPVESFRTGGALWFQDLTITDPYFILPLISASTLFIMIQVDKKIELQFLKKLYLPLFFRKEWILAKLHQI
jgi:YidC/Oxa1 family membrane protein insertase